MGVKVPMRQERNEVRSEYMVKILAVYDANPAFGERLADYVNQKEKIPFTAMAFSSLDRLMNIEKKI